MKNSDTTIIRRGRIPMCCTCTLSQFSFSCTMLEIERATRRVTIGITTSTPRRIRTDDLLRERQISWTRLDDRSKGPSHLSIVERLRMGTIAWVEGIEPSPFVLETNALPLHYTHVLLHYVVLNMLCSLKNTAPLGSLTSSIQNRSSLLR